MLIIPDFNSFGYEKRIMLGAMVGDIMGVPHEFKSRFEIKNSGFVDNPLDITRSYNTYSCEPRGVYSDDFSQMLCVNTCIDDDTLNFYDELLEWRNGKYWVNNKLFDIGMQTASSLEYYAHTGNIAISQPTRAGNGAIMRLAPLAIATTKNLDELIEYYTVITHNNDLCKVTSKFYVNLIRNIILSGRYDIPFADFFRKTSRDYEFETKSNNLGSGYVIDTIMSILYCIKNSDNFTDAVKTAILLGEDTDTTASCVGAVAAVYYENPFESLPKDWIEYMQISFTNPYVKKTFNLGI